MFLLVVILLPLECFLTKQTPPSEPAYVTDYFHLTSTIDQPVPLRKHYGMQQSSIDFYPGTMNVILSVPHDGNLQSNLPTRPKGACRKVNSTSKKCYYQHPCSSSKFRMDAKHCRISHGRDVNTRLLALALRYELSQLFRWKPFVIINRLQRSKIDMNRFIDEGTFGVKESMHAWMRYHFYLKHAREMIIENRHNYGGKGLLFDLHSQEHREGWVELGYMLTSRQLASRKYNLKSSSLASYLTTLFEPLDLISGNKSLGHFLTKYNYSATPSPTFPSPSEQSYFEWGYTIEEYGRYGNFSAIMIESPARELTNLTKLYVYVKSLALALHEYLIEIELFEALVAPEAIESSPMSKQCNSSERRGLQIGVLLLLLVHVCSFI